MGIILGDNKLNKANLENEDELKIRKVKRKLTDDEIKDLDQLDEKARKAYFICKKIVKRVLRGNEFSCWRIYVWWREVNLLFHC